MPQFKVEVYVDDIYVKTLFEEADDQNELEEYVHDKLRVSLLVEELDDV